MLVKPDTWVDYSDTELSVALTYSGRSSLFSDSSACPDGQCLLGTGTWTGTLKGKPLVGEATLQQMNVQVRTNPNLKQLSNTDTTYLTALFDELRADCLDTATFTVAIHGWLNYSSFLVANQEYETDEFELGCSKSMMAQLRSGANAASPVQPTIWLMLLACILSVTTTLCL